MKVCWNRSPRSAQEIIDSLAPPASRHPKTVKTLLNRLVKKGALGFKRTGGPTCMSRWWRSRIV